MARLDFDPDISTSIKNWLLCCTELGWPQLQKHDGGKEWVGCLTWSPMFWQGEDQTKHLNHWHGINYYNDSNAPPNHWWWYMIQVEENNKNQILLVGLFRVYDMHCQICINLDLDIETIYKSSIDVGRRGIVKICSLYVCFE